VRWQETALLFFRALAFLSVGKKQMCCLRVGFFSSNVDG
jgi:hypothetical protein